MGKTVRRVNRDNGPRNEPYTKRIRGDFSHLKGASVEEIEELYNDDYDDEED